MWPGGFSPSIKKHGVRMTDWAILKLAGKSLLAGFLQENANTPQSYFASMAEHFPIHFEIHFCKGEA